jgi:hypothetical protein
MGSSVEDSRLKNQGNSGSSRSVLLPTTRLQSGIRKPKVYTNGKVRYGCFTSTGEPQSLQDVLENKNCKHAMDQEFSALENNGTWTLVPYESGKNIIDCQSVYKIKRKADGAIDRYKA